jgi:hypothetical protein
MRGYARIKTSSLSGCRTTRWVKVQVAGKKENAIAPPGVFHLASKLEEPYTGRLIWRRSCRVMDVWFLS